jgi:two-component system sensor histidine kinase DegS
MAVQELRELARDSSRELDVLRSESLEINMLVKQTSSEVERLEGQAAEITARLNEAETSPDNYTRAEMRSLYSNVHEVEMRLFMMKGQMEHLEYKQETIRENQQRLQRVIEIAADLLGEDSDLAELSINDDEKKSSAARATRTRAREQDFGKLIAAQEDERQRIARRIHDGPAQALANLI